MKENQNSTPSNMQGRMIGASLTVHQAEDVRDYYKQVIGWAHVEVNQGNYADFRMTAPDGQFVAGVHHHAGIFSGLPPVWIPTFLVSDLRTSLEVCRSLGGKVWMEPATYEKNSGAVIEYPVGAFCGLCQI
jgi:predicted enzyme related to lactoylglutathione lyase